MTGSKAGDKRDLEIYIHIPFCVRKCAYCDFLSAPADEPVRQKYLSALKKEIEAFPYPERYEAVTIFFGGGTPSLLTVEQVEDILEALKNKFSLSKRIICRQKKTEHTAENAREKDLQREELMRKNCLQENIMLQNGRGEELEVSLECNPGTATLEKLKGYRRLGVNRLSIGLQSADNRELQLLGRIHTWETFLAIWQDAAQAGFTNRNIDLMSALPGQTMDSYRQTLKKVLSLSPEHISAYSLIIEEGTPFYERYHEEDERRAAGEDPAGQEQRIKEEAPADQEQKAHLPSEEVERQMYDLTRELLKDAGLYRYEISNYARKGYECRHNCGYWRRIDYIGFGLGASSLLQETRWKNTDSLTEYLENPGNSRSSQLLSREDQMEEFMFLGLRVTEGIREEQFQKKFGETIDAIYPETIRNLCRKGLLKRESGQIALTPFGLDFANTVMAEFLL